MTTGMACHVKPISQQGNPFEAWIWKTDGSRAEFSRVKQHCVRLANAWVSDRFLCYLASCKPVIVERTGPSQSHSASHRALSELNPAPQEKEPRPSEHTLEDALGKPVEILSFPFGDGCDASQVEGLLREAGYRAACLYSNELNPLPIENPYRLKPIWRG